MRPRNDDGILMQQAHKRHERAGEMEGAAIFAMSRDNRACVLTMGKKIALARKAIDHVIDGDKMPKWVGKKDTDRPENMAMLEIWRAAVDAVRGAK